MGANLSTFPHSTLHGNANDAIVAIETELGLSPSDTFSTVKARLDSIAAKLGAISPVPGALLSWTPSIVQGVSVTTTNTQSHYMRIGRWVQGFFFVTVTGAGTASNTVEIQNLPATANAAGNLPIGSGMIIDVSANIPYTGVLVLPSAGSMNIRNQTAGLVESRLGAVQFTAGLASGDQIMGTFAFEANAD